MSSVKRDTDTGNRQIFDDYRQCVCICMKKESYEIMNSNEIIQ